MKTAVKIDPEKIARLKARIKDPVCMERALEALCRELNDDF